MADCIHGRDARAQRKIVIHFAKEIDYKNTRLMEMEREIDEKDMLLEAALKDIESLKLENAKLKHEMNSHRRKFDHQAEELVKSLKERQSMKIENEKLLYEIESLMQKLEQQKKELERSMKETQSIKLENKKLNFKLESQRKELEQQIQELEMCAMEERAINMKIEKLDHGTETTKKYFEHQATELVKCPGLEDEGCKEQGNGKGKQKMEFQKKDFDQLILEMKEHHSDNDSKQHHLVAEKEELKGRLKDLEDDIDGLKAVNNVLMLKERKSNDELQDARKEALTVLQGMLNSRTTIRMRRMGEIDRKPFKDVCLQKFSEGEWEEESAKLCSMWEEKLKNPNWHPFKTEDINGEVLKTINEDDKMLKELRNEGGEDVYKAVINALLELEEYNPSGRYPVCELWNPKETRKATLKEIIAYMANKLPPQRKRKRS